MLKILDRRGTFPVVDLCSSVYENASTSTCQPRRSQRHGGGPTLPNSTTEIPTAEEDRNFLQRLSRVGHCETPDTSDEAEPCGESTLVSAMLGAPRRSQRSQKRSRFMDDEYLSLPWIGRMTSNDDAKVVVVEQRKSSGNEQPAVKKRSFKNLSSSETSVKNSPKTTIDSTSPTLKGVGRVVTRRSLGPVVRYPIGTRLNVKYGAVNPQIYEAKVIDVDIVPQVSRYRVHYRGWNKSHDSWITRIDVVSVIEKPSSSTSTTGSEATVKPSPDTTPKISTKVFPTDCKLSISRHKGGSGKDSKTTIAAEEEEKSDAESQRRKKRKQDSEDEEENGEEDGGSVRERQTRSGRRKQQCLSSTNEGNPDGDARSWSGSDESPAAAEETMEVEGEARNGTDGDCVESVAEAGVVGGMVALEAGETPLEDGNERNGKTEDGEKTSSGAEEEEEADENGVEHGGEGSSGAEEDEGKEDGSEKVNDDDDNDNGERDSGNNGGRNNDDDDDDDSDDENDGEDDGEDDDEEEKDEKVSEDHDSDSKSQSATAPTHPSSETLLVSLDQKSTLIYDSIVTSESSSSSCESDSGEPAFGDDVKTMTSDDFLDEEMTAHDDDISVSNSNSDDACNDLLLPIETDSVRSGATSSITSDHHRRRPDSSGNTTTTLTTTSGSGSQLYDDAESTRHFARIHSLPPPSTTSFIDLEAELKGLDETEKEDYILRKMRKIQIEYKQMSSIYNKLTRRSNRASNRRKSRSRRHANGVAIATADTEAPPVC